MNLLQDGIIAMLASIGLASILWILVGSLLHFSYRPAMPAYLVVPAEGDAPELQQTVHELERLRRELRGLPTIVILDCGLFDEARRVAQLLAEEDRRVDLCRPEEFAVYQSMYK